MAPKKGVTGLDAYARMNFLHQASALCSTFPSSSSHNLAAYYGNIFKQIAKKSVIRAEPEIKRTLCKGCSVLLVAGENVKVRLHKKKNSALVWTCLRCQTVKRFGVRKDYKMWIENEEAVVETKEFGSNMGAKPCSSNQETVDTAPTPNKLVETKENKME